MIFIFLNIYIYVYVFTSTKLKYKTIILDAINHCPALVFIYNFVLRSSLFLFLFTASYISYLNAHKSITSLAHQRFLQMKSCKLHLSTALCLRGGYYSSKGCRTPTSQDEIKGAGVIIVVPQSVHTQMWETHGNVGNYSYSKICARRSKGNFTWTNEILI